MEREEAARALELLSNVVREARDDAAIQGWGRVWILHAFSNGGGFLGTHLLLRAGWATPWPFVALWGPILAFNLATLFILKKRRAGVPSFVERQIWTIWTTFVVALALVAVANWILGLETLFVGPMAAILGAVALATMGSVVGAVWYVPAVLLAGAALGMAALPAWQFAILAVIWTVFQGGAGIYLVVRRRRREAEGGDARLV